MLTPEVRVRWLMLLLLACDGGSAGGGGSKDDEPDRREAVLALCDDACLVQANGEGCSDIDYLDWCESYCRTLEGVVPEGCLDEAEAALTCWIEVEWYCTGETSYYGVDLPLPEDEEACADVTEAFYSCG